MASLPSKSTPRRWVLWRDETMLGTLTGWHAGDYTEDRYDEMLSDPTAHELVEVMPVSEHARVCELVQKALPALRGALDDDASYGTRLSARYILDSLDQITQEEHR